MLTQWGISLLQNSQYIVRYAYFIHPLSSLCPAMSALVSEAQDWCLNVPPLHNQPLNKSPKAGQLQENTSPTAAHWKSRLTQFTDPFLLPAADVFQTRCPVVYFSEHSHTPSFPPPFSSSFGWHPLCYSWGDAEGSLRARPGNYKTPMASSRAKRTHGGLGSALGGNLMGCGASSEAGCRLVRVRVCVLERESEWYVKGSAEGERIRLPAPRR